MYGWKGRIGLLVPSRNTTMEPEFNRIAPEGVSIHAARMFLKENSPAALIKMEKEIDPAVSLIMAVNPDVIVFGDTSGSFIKGLGYDQKLIKKISGQTKIKAITTSTAVIEALKLLKVTKVAVATPYTEEVNEKEREFIEAHGIRVTRIKGLGYSKPVKLYPLASNPVSGMGLLNPSVAYKLAQDVDSREAEGIFISCTNFRTIEIIEALEKNVGKPVVTSNQASMSMALRVMGIREKITGFGVLLEKGSSLKDARRERRR
ncbi:MAG: maleate cis-trans isomerase [Pseudomonadota bacterium]